MRNREQPFGCGQCVPAEPAPIGRLGLAVVERLVAESHDEADRMIAAGAAADITELVEIGKTRHYLCDERLTGREPTVGYELGWPVPPHD